MIKYALHCANGHAFESWFQSGPVFDAQAASGLVSCPVCQSSAVAKAIMAPAVARSDRGAAPIVRDAPAQPEPAEGPNLALLSAADAERRAAIVELRRRILEHSADLGPKFAEEALKSIKVLSRIGPFMARPPSRKPASWRRKGSTSCRSRVCPANSTDATAA